MSASGKSLTSNATSRLTQLEGQQAAIISRIAKLESLDTVTGYGKETSQDETTKIKAARLARYQATLNTIESALVNERRLAAETSTVITAPAPVVAEKKQKSISEEPASRDWYSQFEEQHIMPAIKKLHSSTIVKGKPVWNDVDDSAVRQQFIALSKQILTHYQNRGLATHNLENYIEAIAIADRHLTPLRKTMRGYLNLLPIATSFAEAKAKKVEVQLPGELGRAFSTFKKGNKPETTAAGKTKIPLITINSDAERDFALTAIKFMQYFIVKKSPDLSYDQRSLNMAMKLDIVRSIFVTHEAKFALRVHDYEAGILLATPTEAPSPSSKSANSQHRVVTPPAPVITLDIQEPALFAPQQTPAAGTLKSVVTHAAPIITNAVTQISANTPENVASSSIASGIVVPKIAAPTKTHHRVASSPAVSSEAVVTSAPGLLVNVSQHKETSAVIASQTATQQSSTRPSITQQAVIPVTTVRAISPRITRLSSTTTVITQPETEASPAINPAPANALPAEKPSFFQRHKKKILWGLGIGLLVGLSIATGGVLAVMFSATVAATVAVVGVTTLASTIGLGVGVATTIGVLGAAGTAAGCAVFDYQKSSTESPATAIIDHGHTAITDGYDTGRIHRETRMPIATPGANSAPDHQNTATNTRPAPQTTLTHDADYDHTRIEQPSTPRI
jgi:hypothetical protein